MSGNGTGNKAENDTGNKVGDKPEKGSRAFKRKDVTEAELAEARKERDRILGLHALATPPSVIGKLTHHKVRAIEAVIAEGPAPAGSGAKAPTPTTSYMYKDGSTSDAPKSAGPRAPTAERHDLTAEEVARALGEAPNAMLPSSSSASDWSSGPWEIRTPQKAMFDAMRMFQIPESVARGLTIQFFNLHAANDYGSFDKMLGTASVAAWARVNAVATYRSMMEPGGAADGSLAPGGDEDRYMTIVIAPAGFPMQQRIERKDFPMWAPFIPKPIANGPVAGGSNAESAEMAALRERNRLLETALHDKELLDRIDARLAPLQAQIREVAASARGGARSLTDVEIADADRQSIIKGRAQTELFSEAATRLHDGPHIGAKVGGLLDKVTDSPALNDAILRQTRHLLSTPEERAGVGVPPTDAELLEAGQRLEREAGLRQMGGAPTAADLEAEVQSLENLSGGAPQVSRRPMYEPK
ncbi:MAG: hypothetical protein WA688_09340 [Thermoplasmata archaeon]